MKTLFASLKNLFAKNQAVTIYESFDGQNCFNANKKIALNNIENTFDIDFHATKKAVKKMIGLNYTVDMLVQYSGYSKNDVLFMIQL